MFNRKIKKFLTGILTLGSFTACTAAGGSKTNPTYSVIKVNDNEIGMVANINDYWGKESVINDGIITINGTKAVGMKANGHVYSKFGKAYNSGTINIEKNNSIGMLAKDGGDVINQHTGIINVNASNSYAMVADGSNSRAYNYGTINLNSYSLGRDNAMKATAGGEIFNYGKIYDYSGNKLNISTDDSGKYILGTAADGSYGTLAAKSISIDGNMEISSDIVQGSYKDSYVLKNIMETEAVEFQDNFKLSSSSLLYDAAIEKTTEGADGVLTRNNTTIASLAASPEKEMGEIFDNAITGYGENLSAASQKLTDTVFANTSSAAALSLTLQDLSGDIYGNIPRQLFDTKDIFKNYDSSVISNIGENDFNFTLISSYSDIESRYGIRGYESKLNGFVGGVKLDDSLYLTLGYGHNDISYTNSSAGKIDTLHAGLYKYKDFGEYNSKIGIIGEYSFNETKREISTLKERAESDFDSYLVGINGEISRTFGDDLYIKPSLGFDLSYGKYESFTEKNSLGNVSVSSEDYLSAVPSAELQVGKKFGFADIYAGIKYSYELGDMEKNQYVSLGTLGGYHLASDSLESSSTELKIGTSLSYNSLSLNLEAGRDFGKRDNKFVTLGFGYTF